MLGGFVQRKGVEWGRNCPQKGVAKKKKGREIDGKKKMARKEGRKEEKCRGKWRKEDSTVASKSRQMDEHGSSGASAQLGEGWSQCTARGGDH